MTTKFELQEGKWLVTIKDGRVKIKDMKGYITLKEDTFLNVKSNIHEVSKIVAEVKSTI